MDHTNQTDFFHVCPTLPCSVCSQRWTTKYPKWAPILECGNVDHDFTELVSMPGVIFCRKCGSRRAT